MPFTSDAAAVKSNIPADQQTPGVHPCGSQSLASPSNHHFSMFSLEDLEKLLAKRNPFQQQLCTTMPFPRTYALQKHASHSLRQSHPRLPDGGTSLLSSPHVHQPHQQLQQSTETSQIPVNEPVSEYLSTRSSSQNALGHTVISATQ